MKHKLLSFSLLSLLILSFASGYSQDPNNPRWNQDPRTVVNLSSDYVPLPNTGPEILQFTTDPRTTITPNGVLIAYPNVRVHPSGANDFSQSEVPIVSSPINRNILFGSSNAYTFSTGNINSGVYVSVDGGVTWTGAENLGAGSINNQRGDPGPMISKFGTFLFTHLTSNTNFGAVTGMGTNRSVDNGATWTNTFQVVADGNADKNLGASDDYPSSPFYGQSYFAWTSFGTNPANGRTSRTINDGVSWSSPIVINSTPAGHNAQGHDVATGPNGEVYIVWTAGINVSPFTEDFVGMAKSVNGGVSYVATENIFDDNGSRSNSYNGWGIRTNGFPRIAVDKTGGVRNGWIYIVVSQVNLAPAGSDADVVLHRSSDGGATWSAGIRVNQDGLNNGKVQFFPAVCVDSDGGVDVVYYDNRNFPSVGDSLSVYISRSQDGGSTWSDVQIADHHFKPKQMSPFGGGYMGDYIGITPSIGKVVALWSDDKAAPVGSNKPSAWAGALDISQSTICQDFSSVTFPPSDFLLEYTGTLYWSRQAPSAYAIGTGSTEFNSWSASSGTTQSMVTHKFLPVGANTYLTFDEAYAPWSSNIDSLIIEVSSNGGTTYSNLVRLWGGPAGGPLVSTSTGFAELTAPTGGQWRPKIYALPAGTDKIRFKGVSGFGNNIWVDNICLQILAAPITNSIGLASEGMWTGVDPYWAIIDTVSVYLARTDFPNVKVDSARFLVGSNAVLSSLTPFNNALTGNYYKVVKHRNMIEIWSAAGLPYSRGNNTNYNFIFPAGAAYANNQHIVDPGPPYYGMFSGDCVKDASDIIDVTDLVALYNGALVFASDLVRDLNADGIVDVTDIVVAYNNSINIVTVIRPPGAAPLPPPAIENDKMPQFKTDAERQKWELTIKLAKQNQNENIVERNLIRETNPELYDMMQKIIEERSKQIKSNSINTKNNTNSETHQIGIVPGSN